VDADANELAAAYLLGLLTEKDYTAYHRDHDNFPCFASFSVGQRKDLQGDASGAAAAYRRCLEADEKGGSRAIVSLVRWRLKKFDHVETKPSADNERPSNPVEQAPEEKREH
jgi:hypothetical protein